MNVFAPHFHPTLSARALHDKHVVKMTLETAQLASTVAHEFGIEFPGQYRPTHANHPCTRAMIESPLYRAWVMLHGAALAAEYTRRYGKRHKSQDVIEAATEALGPYPSIWHQRIPFPLCMPEEFHRPVETFEPGASICPHASYRAYLAAKYGAWEAT